MFLALLLVTALSIAGVAAFFSIYGLAHIYSGAFFSVVIMAAVLEAGKLVSVSFLYRYWQKINWWLKSFLLVLAIPGLMLITSAGVFGYLSNAYQQDSVDLKDVQVQIELLESEKAELDQREAQIDADVARVADNYITKRMELMEQYRPEKEYLSQRRIEIRQELYELNSRQLQVEAHTGPIIYIAKAFGKDVDTAILWMTLLIIFVFDPLAVALTLGYNIAVGKKYSDDHETPPTDATSGPGTQDKIKEPGVETPQHTAPPPVESETLPQTDISETTLDDLWPEDVEEEPSVDYTEVVYVDEDDIKGDMLDNEPTVQAPPPTTHLRPGQYRFVEEPTPKITTNEQLSQRLRSLTHDPLK